jgi:hypothetical protein
MRIFIFVLILSLLLAVSTQKASDPDLVLIGYLKYLKTKLLVNNKMMSAQDEQILGVILDLVKKRSRNINEESMKKFERLLRPILMRRQKNETEKPKEISKLLHWRQGR